MVTKITDAVLQLLDGGPKTPEQLRVAINLSPDFKDLRQRWGGSVETKQVYAAMSGLRSKGQDSKSSIMPEGGEPSMSKLYAITPYGRREIERRGLRPLAAQPVAVEHVNHPPHYGGEDNPYEAIKVIEAWELPFNTGNTVKYISRAGHKSITSLSAEEARLQDLRKARWYLDREISNIERLLGHE